MNSITKLNLPTILSIKKTKIGHLNLIYCSQFHIFHARASLFPWKQATEISVNFTVHSQIPCVCYLWNCSLLWELRSQVFFQLAKLKNQHWCPFHNYFAICYLSRCMKVWCDTDSHFIFTLLSLTRVESWDIRNSYYSFNEEKLTTTIISTWISSYRRSILDFLVYNGARCYPIAYYWWILNFFI